MRGVICWLKKKSSVVSSPLECHLLLLCFFSSSGCKFANGGSLQKHSPEVFCKKDVLKNFEKFTGKPLYQNLRRQACSFIKKKTLAQMFCCKFCEIFKSISGRLFLYFLRLVYVKTFLEKRFLFKVHSFSKS